MLIEIVCGLISLLLKGMSKYIFVYVTLISLVACTPESSQNAQYVNPFIGTDATHFVSEWRSEGCTYPGAVAPHGIAQPSPETNSPKDRNKGYYYSQDTIYRFSMTEHFSGWPDGSKGKGVFMPFSLAEEKKTSLSESASFFRHENEKAIPGYYEVFLETPKITCSFAALTRSAITSFKFQQSGYNGLILRGFDSINYLSNTTLEVQLKAGSQYITSNKESLFISIIFDKPFTVINLDNSNQLVFESDEVKMKYGASYTSAKNAQLNLNEEIPLWNVEEVAQQSNALWNEALSNVEIPKGKEEDKTSFYTALYHAQLLPVNATDVNGEYPGFELGGALRENEQHYIYYTPWDAFRAKQPLYNLLYPNKSRDFLRSMVRIYQMNGVLPEPEVMTGVHLSSVVADALAKGITDFEVELAYKGLEEMILTPPYFRDAAMTLYDSLGHVPYPQRYATTATLEFAFNDWALAQIADYLGKKDIADKLKKRSLNYKNHFNPASRLMETKNEDGTWAEASIYAEANAWNMSWLAPHDPQGLINLMGGDAFFVEHLERNFEEGLFILDNECPLNFPFLFSYAGQPWKTMKWSRESLNYYFNNSPGGIPGNDDWGSISSWFTWSALGLFPSNPGVDELVIAGPLFEQVILKLPNKQQVTIEAKNASKENMYIQTMEIDGKEYDNAFISQKALFEAKHISFTMSDTPNKSWGMEKQEFHTLTAEKPSFELLDLQLDEQDVSSHELINVKASIQNNGVVGSYPLVININQKPTDTVFVLLENKQIKEVELPLQLYKAGNYAIRVADKEVQVNVTATNLSVEEALHIKAPIVAPLATANERLDYRVEVQNVSGQSLTHTPKLFVDNKPVVTLEVISLQPGEIKILEGVLPAITEKGFHQLRVDKGQSSTFKVYEAASETLVLHYTFDENTSDIRDHSGFGNHGDLVGESHNIQGVKGKGLKPEKGYVRAPNSPSLTIESEELTVLCWYKPADEDGRASLITKGAHHMMKLNNSGQLQLAIGGWGVGQNAYNVPKDKETGKPKWQGKWSQFVGSRIDDTLFLYYNGVKVRELKVSGEIGQTPWSWRIGSNAEIPLGRTPDGVIDEVMIFAKALSEKEVMELYKSVRLEEVN